MLSTIGNLMNMLSQNKQESPPPPPPQQNADMSNLLGLLSSLGGGSAPKSREQTPTSKIFGTKEENQHRIALLNAVKPYLSDERRDKLDGVIKLLKLTELGELSGLLSKT